MQIFSQKKKEERFHICPLTNECHGLHLKNVFRVLN